MITHSDRQNLLYYKLDGQVCEKVAFVNSPASISLQAPFLSFPRDTLEDKIRFWCSHADKK